MDLPKPRVELAKAFEQAVNWTAELKKDYRGA
jgi:hypothetical protein